MHERGSANPNVRNQRVASEACGVVQRQRWKSGCKRAAKFGSEWCVVLVSGGERGEAVLQRNNWLRSVWRVGCQVTLGVK